MAYTTETICAMAVDTYDRLRVTAVGWLQMLKIDEEARQLCEDIDDFVFQITLEASQLQDDEDDPHIVHDNLVHYVEAWHRFKDLVGKRAASPSLLW